MAETVALLIVGLCAVEEYPFGPAQAYVPTPPPVRAILFPAQMTGVLVLAVAAGFAFTVTAVVAVEIQLAPPVTVIV